MTLAEVLSTVNGKPHKQDRASRLTFLTPEAQLVFPGTVSSTFTGCRQAVVSENMLQCLHIHCVLHSELLHGSFALVCRTITQSCILQQHSSQVYYLEAPRGAWKCTGWAGH